MIERRASPSQRGAVAGEGDGDRGHGAGGDDQQQRPGVEERRQGAEGLAQIDVAAAGLRAPLAELAEAERADQRDHPAADPDAERERRRCRPAGRRWPDS